MVVSLTNTVNHPIERMARWTLTGVRDLLWHAHARRLVSQLAEVAVPRALVRGC